MIDRIRSIGFKTPSKEVKLLPEEIEDKIKHKLAIIPDL